MILWRLNYFHHKKNTSINSCILANAIFANFFVRWSTNIETKGIASWIWNMHHIFSLSFLQDISFKAKQFFRHVADDENMRLGSKFENEIRNHFYFSSYALVKNMWRHFLKRSEKEIKVLKTRCHLPTILALISLHS